MQIIWDMNKKTDKIDAGSMMDAYPEVIGHLKLTTVLTLLTRLGEKGFIKTDRTGRLNYYSPVVGEDEYKKAAAVDFVESVYKNNPFNLITALFDAGAIKREDIDKLRAELFAGNDAENDGGI